MYPFQDFLTPPPPTPTLPGAPGPQAAPLPAPLPGPTATPVPGAPVTLPEPISPSAAAASTNTAAVVALFIYLVFFGVLGYRRGAQRELWVLAVSLLLAFGLQQFSNIVVLVFDRFGKGLAFLTGQPIPEQSALGAWAAANTQTLLVLLWLAGVVLTYILTGRFVRKSKKDGWAALLGVLNGLVLATVFAPLLTTLILPNTTLQGPLVQLPILSLLSNVWQQLAGIAARFWAALGPMATNVFFAAIVFLVLFAAFTLRTSVKPKS